LAKAKTIEIVTTPFGALEVKELIHPQIPLSVLSIAELLFFYATRLRSVTKLYTEPST